MVKESNFGENKNSWNKLFHIDVKYFALPYTLWANGKNNVISSQSTLIWKDWDIFYLWRKDINLYLKNVVLASLYFSLEYLEEKYQPHSLNTAIGQLCKWATPMWKHFQSSKWVVPEVIKRGHFTVWQYVRQHCQL